MNVIELAANLLLFMGAVNTGILISGENALLFDCGDRVTCERLSEVGVKKIDMILCTQHRRVNTAGAYKFVNDGTKLVVPAVERKLFEETDAYWNEWKNRWHLYQSQPGPQVLASPLPGTKSISGRYVMR